jgi:hypothetical protein
MNGFNDPHRYATSQTTVEAILYCVRTRGVMALEEPGNKERLAKCDTAAKEQITERIKGLRERGLL